MSENQSNASILIVDDVAENLRMLGAILSQHGYKVRSAKNGYTAVNSARINVPDLILLDVEMPGIDGHETCRLIKADERTKDVPVIFLSGTDNCTNKAIGFKAGAVDDITKPFDTDELLARVEMHLTIKKLEGQLREQNEMLEKMIQQKEEIENIIRHDIRGPLFPIINLPEKIIKQYSLDEKSLKYLKLIEAAGNRILNLVDNPNPLYHRNTKSDSIKLKPLDLIQIIDNIISGMVGDSCSCDIRTRVLLEDREIYPEDIFTIRGEEGLCYTMLENDIRNAYEASKPNQVVTIRLMRGIDRMIEIHNEEAVPEPIREDFFEKHVTYGKREGTGLGTYSAKQAADIQGAEISMKTSETSGTFICIKFPGKVNGPRRG